MKGRMTFSKEVVSTILEIVSYQSAWLQILIPKVNENMIQPNSETASDKWADVIVNGGSLIAEDFEDGSEYTFNLHDMEKGWKEFSKDYSEESANIENDEADHTDCDIYIQYVLFGEYVYG